MGANHAVSCFHGSFCCGQSTACRKHTQLLWFCATPATLQAYLDMYIGLSERQQQQHWGVLSQRLQEEDGAERVKAWVQRFASS